MGIQVIDIIGSGLWIIKAQNLRVFVSNKIKILPWSINQIVNQNYNQNYNWLKEFTKLGIVSKLNFTIYKTNYN